MTNNDDEKPWWQCEIGTGGVLALTGLFLVALLPLSILPPLGLFLGWYLPILFPTVNFTPPSCRFRGAFMVAP